MTFLRTLAALAVLSMATLSFTGCGGDESGSDDSNDAHDDHDHDHDHAHSHDGPHGGISFDFDQSGYKGEWNHDNEHQIVRIYILDAEGKEGAMVAAEKVIVRDTKGREPQEYELLAEDASDDGTASTFAKKSGPLLAAMPLGVEVEVEIDGEKYTAKVEPHVHHDH